jgi:signal transduction histidine kinase
VQISLVVMRAQKTFKAAFKERNLTLITDGLDQVPVILADADLIYKVFYHLMMNAIKYTQDGGQITISGRAVNDNPEKPEIEVVISDTGIGIDKEHHELVFEKFYQTGELHLHSSGRTKFKGGGPGLGLAIARGILEAHDGRIWVESAGHDEKAHLGSQFYIRLPISGPAER